MNMTDNEQRNKSIIDKRKRINRMKTIIIIVVIILMVLPTIFCISLGIQVSRLQKQMKELVSIHDQYGLSNVTIEDKYAYAAEKVDLDIEKTMVVSEDEITVEKTDPIINIEETTTDTEVSSKEATEVKEKNKIKDKEKPQNNGIYSGKKVYLTFDDGPSTYTADILDILADYEIKATFFVTGKTDKQSKKLYKRIVEEGHTLGMHSYSHIYGKIYNSIEDFDKDFTKLWKLLYDTTGNKPSIFRFPGGSDNLVNKNGMDKFIRYLNEASITYYDWNVVNGDATGVVYTKEQLIDNVLEGVTKKDTSIVLMHDAQTKKTTVDSLPGLLNILIAEDAQILPIDKDTKPIQMIKSESLK
jgi:peptidoglycan/xylan/chitin deacetylase (PgdA/CDA1 family)